MALQVINTTVTGTGTVIDLGTTDSLWVGRSGLIASTSFGSGVYGSGSYHSVRVEGAITGGFGLHLGYDPNAASNNTVLIAHDGIVSGSWSGLSIYGINSSVINYGIVDGAVTMWGNGPGQSRITNAGEIYGGHFAVTHYGTETLILTNSGTIRGDGYSFYAPDFDGIAVERIRNTGEMYGDVALGGGDDRYDGRGGMVDGVVFGGAGNDSFVSGSAYDNFDGGAGIDTLDFRRGAGVQVYLDGSGPNTGTAAGDDYIGMENIQGSTTGNDKLFGDGADNVLSGYGGVDVLSGADGADSLVGGAAADRITGGAGNDLFVFEKLGDCGDIITDFGNVVGNDDGFQISTAFGGTLAPGLLAANLFQSAAGFTAANSSIRFMWDTTNKDLWFDSDGNGFASPIMVANLQASAVVTNLDISIF